MTPEEIRRSAHVARYSLAPEKLLPCAAEALYLIAAELAWFRALVERMAEIALDREEAP